MFLDTHQKFFDLAKSMKSTFEKVPDMDLVILYDEKNQFHINRAMKLLDGVKNVHTVTTTDPFNIEIEKETGTALKGRKVFWLS